MSESAISAKSAKQIFANFVKFVKPIFGTTRRSEGSVTEAEYPTNYQRISNLSLTIRPFRVAILAVLLVFVGSWNTQAFAAWSGSGEAVSHSGSTYYVYDDSSEKSKTAGGLVSAYFDELTLSGPGATVSFQAKKTKYGSGNLVLQQYNGSWSDVWSNGLGTSYSNYSQGINYNSTKIQFYIPSGSLKKYYRNLKVTMAQYMENPMKDSKTCTKLDCGTEDINKDPTSNTFTIAWCNLPAMKCTITGTDKDLFSVSISNNSEAGKYNTATFTVTCDHKKRAGSHSATLTIKDGNGNNTKTVTLSGTTNKLQPEVTWSPNDETFNVDDVLTATNSNGLTVTLSSTGNESYVGCAGNSATMLAATTGKITITAHVTGNDIYADKDIAKEITITNLEKQYISWDQDFSRLKTTDGTKSITLNATSSSNLPVTYELVGDKTGLSLTQSGSVWTLTYSATECKNTTIVAKQGGDATYAPASSVSKTVKVIDPTKVCDTNETLVNSTVTLKSQSTTYNIDIPSTMTIQVSRTKTGTFDWYFNGFKVEIYSGRNGTGKKLHEYSYDASDINNSKTISLSNLNIAAKSVKLISDASNGYNVNSVTYTKQKKCTISPASLSFETYPNTETSAKTFDVTYANYPISLECSNPKFTFSPAEFGDCDAYGTQTISVKYTAGADEGNDVGYLFIKDNTGTTLKTCTLNVSISKVSQSITSHTIAKAYKTTDRVELSAVANSKLTDFVYSASPEGVASFDGNVMTFSQSGTIAITVTQPGSDIYAATSTTVENVVVSKVTPNIVSLPAGTAVTYLQNLSASTLSGGSADVTLRGVAHTNVEGSFAWTNEDYQVVEASGSNSYEVTFKPSDAGMYNNQTCQVAIQVNKATQTLKMNDGVVKVAVDGLDKDAADSKLNLNTLIGSQTDDPVNANRAGSVTYEVISDNKANTTIADGNIFSATKIGEYTIRATKAETEYYNTITADFKVTVTKRANTLTIAGTEYEKFVDDVITDICSKKNSDATIQTSSTYPTVARYDVENNKIVIPNSESDVQMFGEYIMDTIKIWQEATERFEACEKTIIVTVKKYVTASNGEDYIIKVNETKTANYGFVNTSASYPSNNNEDDFYYTIDKPNFENEALNNGTELITYNPATNEITGHNAGTTKITFFQKETYKYTGATLMCNIAVEKRSNQISNSWNNTWQKAMSKNGTASISFTSTHGDYTNYPIAIEQIYGEDVATLTGTASGASIATNTTDGYAIWHLSQAENYEYYSAEADVMVMVGVPAPPTCYVYEDNNEHKFSTEITDAEGHFETPITINSPIDKIWFKAKRQWGGVNYFVVQYSTDNCKTWSTVTSPDLGTDYAEYSASFPTLSGDKRITHVRFGAKTRATLSKWYKDVQISRKAYLNILDADSKKISKLPTMTCTVDTASTAEAKFYIDYSTCADKIYIESSDTVHFTVSRSEITANGDNLTSAKEEITVTYSSTELGEHNAVITVRTSYQTRALSVSGKTEKRTPTITWQENFTNNPLTLPVGLTVNATKPAATTTSTALIKYESSDPNVIKIIEEGYAFKVVGKGTATLTAIVPENEVWKSTSDSREIKATDKVVQEIVWDQTFPRFMEPGDVIDLDAKVYLRNLSTSTLEYSEERSRLITYSCPLNNGIVTISGNKMNLLDYGEVKVTASVGGNADYEAASMTVLITVRKPSIGCETPLVLHKEDVIDMYEVNVDFSNYLDLTTEEMISGEIKIDHSNGKPDKLSFQYEGEEFNAIIKKYFGGYIKFEQRVNSQWIPVEGSRVETVKNEWNAKSGLQLDENADALRIIRESGATGHHYIKDIQVTRKQYLRATQNEINLGEIKIGQTTPVAIGFDYSDIKGDLTARTINNTTDLTIKDNGIIDLECGSFGHYNLQVTFTPTQLDEWQGTVEIYDNIANLSITVALKATVVANEEYIFNEEGNWNENSHWTTNLVPDENADITVAKDMIINSSASVKSITINEGVTVTVKSGVTLVVGDGTPKSREIYGNLHVEDGAQVKLKEGATLPLNDFTLDAALGTIGTSASSGQVEGSNMTVHGDAYFQLTLNPTGENTIGWYDFVLPFEANVSNGISVVDNEGNVLPARHGEDYVVMRYSEAKRAERGKDWIKFNGTMQAGRVYTIAVDANHSEWNTVLFKKNKGAALGASATYEAECSTGEAIDCGWNGLGNGTLQHMKLSDASVKIQVYDHTNNVFETRDDVSGLKFAVGTSFFMQVDEAKAINFVAPTSAQSFLAPARERHTEEFRLALTAGGEERASDRLWVSASEEATGEYVVGHDLLKMGTPSEAKVAQMWAKNEANRLCDIEMPLATGKAKCELGIFAPQEANYTLSVEKMPDDAMLYLTYNGRPVWNLTYAPYTFDLTQGFTEGYGLQISVTNAPQVTTGVDEVQGGDVRNTKVIIDNKMFVITPQGAMYDATGKKIQ